MPKIILDIWSGRHSQDHVARFVLDFEEAIASERERCAENANLGKEMKGLCCNEQPVSQCSGMSNACEQDEGA